VKGNLAMPQRELLEGKKILIVDDEPDVLDTLEQLLEMCETVCATTFEEAKNYLETEYFDIIILDIMGVDGYELLKIAKKRHMIAAMLTAHALTPSNVVKSYKEGAASYIPKDEISNITLFLNDILEAKEQGKNFWWRWLDRLDSFFEKRFGPDWKTTHNKEFWDKYIID
jgi:DNA-binding NtrC family response regulator